jgi:hypothetical protein
MNTKNIFRNGCLSVLCAMTLLLVAAQSFGVVTNGFFDLSLDNGWNYSNDGSVVRSPDSYAEMNEDGTLLNSQLWQRFLVDDGSQTLTFTVHTTQPVGGETDHFYIGLFQDSDVPLLLDGSNSLFHWDSAEGHEGYANPDYFDWDFSDDPDGGLLYDFTIPVADLNDQSVTLMFQLDHVWGIIEPSTGEISDPITTVKIDNVELHGTGTTPPAVPVPGAMGLVLAGLMALGIFKKKLT